MRNFSKKLLIFLVIVANLAVIESFAINYTQNYIKRNCNSEQTICVISELKDDIIYVTLENKDYRTYTINMSIWVSNMKINQSEEVKDLTEIITRPDSKIYVGTLTTIDNTRPFGYNFNYTEYKGIIDAAHNDDFVYFLPYGNTEEYTVVQSYGDKFTHNDEQNFYAYDFKMKIGEAIHAMRGGLVVESVDKFSKGGMTPKLRKKSNNIVIEHDDGTYAVYSHLKYRGSLVKVGNKIQKGQKIGYSGFTGYARDPHLHVAVYKVVNGGKHQSLPIKVETDKGVLTKLQTFKKYKRP